MLAVGGLALLLAGWPFWLTDVPFSLQFAFDRFTLPFMLGVSLLLGGLACLLPVGRWLRAVLLAGLVALAVGMQIGAGYSFVQDWTAQKSLFWQLTWRVPSLRRGHAGHRQRDAQHQLFHRQLAERPIQLDLLAHPAQVPASQRHAVYAGLPQHPPGERLAAGAGKGADYPIKITW